MQMFVTPHHSKGIPVTIPVTIRYPNHHQQEDKEEEDASKNNIDDGRGDGNGDRAEPPHPLRAQVTFLMAGRHHTESSRDRTKVTAALWPDATVSCWG